MSEPTIVTTTSGGRDTRVSSGRRHTLRLRVPRRVLKVYLAAISYPYEGGAVLGAYSTEDAARAAVAKFDGAPGWEAIIEALVIDADEEID